MRGSLFALVITALAASAAAQIATPPAPPAPVPGGRVGGGGGRGGPAQTPPRDIPGTQAPVGTSRLTGRVLAGPNRPLYRAVVQLLTGNLQPSRWTSTDAEGRWSIRDIPAGSYTIVASRDGYVSMGFGQKTAFGSSAPVAVADRQVVENLDITLARGGVITGRITDDRGQPVGGSLVSARRIRFVNGLRELVAVNEGFRALLSGGVTDDRGEYRIYGLAPGTYYLAARYGQIGEGRTDDRSTYAGTYAPGTALISEATPLVVNADRTVTSDFALVRTTLAVVSGRVLNSAGAPSNASVALQPVARGHAIEGGAGGSNVLANASGAFTIRGVAPGNYFLLVRPGTLAPPAPEMAAASLIVSGDDVTNIVIQTTPGGAMRGIVKLDGEPPGATADGFLVGTRAMNPGAMTSRGDNFGRTNGAGEFVIPGLLGTHLVRLENLGPRATGWWLKSVTANGVDVTDTGFEFGPNTNAAVEVTVSRRMASVNGGVRSADGRPAPDSSIVVFAEDEARWGPHTRFIATAGAKPDGTFTIEGLPGGAYVIVAVPPFDAGDETDPTRLKNWRDVGQRMSIGDGESKSAALTMIR